MSEKIFVPTPEMDAAGKKALSDNGVDNVEDSDALLCFHAMISHPSFQSQLRAYVAGEARRLVPDKRPDGADLYKFATNEGHNACRATTLANIAAYEKGEPQ